MNNLPEKHSVELTGQFGETRRKNIHLCSRIVLKSFIWTCNEIIFPYNSSLLWWWWGWGWWWWGGHLLVTGTHCLSEAVMFATCITFFFVSHEYVWCQHLEFVALYDVL
jgi:hypothetical protein